MRSGRRQWRLVLVCRGVFGDSVERSAAPLAVDSPSDPARSRTFFGA
jgi:hypothetical protein